VVYLVKIARNRQIGDDPSEIAQPAGKIRSEIAQEIAQPPRPIGNYL
jgi:hypothetical protein